MRLAESTWPEVQAYLGSSTGIIIPVGSTERHGPNGLIGTDAICAAAIAEAAADEANALVGPVVSFAPAQFNETFPGTISISASTLMALVSDIVRSLSEQGFTRFILSTATAPISRHCEPPATTWPGTGLGSRMVG
jgi:creatinine amidohydrolase